MNRVQPYPSGLSPLIGHRLLPAGWFRHEHQLRVATMCHNVALSQVLVQVHLWMSREISRVDAATSRSDLGAI